MIVSGRRTWFSRRCGISLLAVIITLWCLLYIQLFFTVSEMYGLFVKDQKRNIILDSTKLLATNVKGRGRSQQNVQEREPEFHSPKVSPTIKQRHDRVTKTKPSYTTAATAEGHHEENAEGAFLLWRKAKRTACVGNLELFPGHFVSLRNVLLRKHLVWSRSSGGEEMSRVMNQAEEQEYYRINKGFFGLLCRDLPSDYAFPSHKGHLNDWLSNVAALNDSSSAPSSYVKDFTIIVQRYEYVNIYHSMTDFYSAFLMMKFFQKSPRETNILFFDAHPKGSLDLVWSKLFNSVSRVSQLRDITQFRHAVWSIPGYDTPMYYLSHLKNIPLIEEFRSFFLKQHGVGEKSEIDCKHLRLVIIWRRDYVAHPRNPSGHVQRKIFNEDELIGVAKKTGFFSSIIGIQLDKLSMKRQLSLISNTDILVGMHGAGLTHTLFLPSYSGLIELFPQYFSQLDHFKDLAEWRNLHYIRWQNSEFGNEMSERRTRIPPSVFRQLLVDMKKKLCKARRR